MATIDDLVDRCGKCAPLRIQFHHHIEQPLRSGLTVGKLLSEKDENVDVTDVELWVKKLHPDRTVAEKKYNGAKLAALYGALLYVLDTEDEANKAFCNYFDTDQLAVRIAEFRYGLGDIFHDKNFPYDENLPHKAGEFGGIYPTTHLPTQELFLIDPIPTPLVMEAIAAHFPKTAG